MSTARNKDNEYNEIETSMNGFYSSSLLRWAIDMDMPITRKLFAEVCGYGVLDDVILLHKTYKCKWGGTACKNAISNDHLHILEYLVLNDDGGIAYWYLIRCAVQNGKLDILIWILNKCYPENTIIQNINYNCTIELACFHTAKYNHMNILLWLQSNDVEMDWSCACIGAAQSGNIKLLEWLYIHSKIKNCQVDMCITAAQNGHLNVLEWIRAKYNQTYEDLDICRKAAKHGHLHVLQWLRCQDPPFPWSSSTFNAAICKKQYEITDWLQTIEPSCPVDKTTLVLAARNGDMKLVQWLRSLDPPCPFAHDVCYETLTQKHLDVLQWLLENGAPCIMDWTFFEVALVNNDLESLIWLQSMFFFCPLNTHKAIFFAIKNGNLEMLQWLISRKGVMTEESYKFVAEFGRLDILMWLYAQFPLDFNKVKRRLMYVAAYCGHVGIIKWLRSLNPPCQWDKNITFAAVEGGKLYTLKWLRSQDPPCPWNLDELYKRALRHGDIMLMKCLHSLTKSHPWNSNMCELAAKNGHLRMLRWLRCQDPPCPIKLNQCIELAAKIGDIKTVEWLCTQSGCATCSRHNCRCKNREIKIPEKFLAYKNFVLSFPPNNEDEYSEYNNSSSDGNSSSSSDNGDESVIHVVGPNQYYYDMLAEYHLGSNSDDSANGGDSASNGGDSASNSDDDDF
jgi:hypothetical protein